MRFHNQQLKNIAEVFNGKTPARSEQRSTGHPVLKIKDVSEDGIFVGKFDSFVDDAFLRKFKQKCIKPGDTLILNAAHNSEYVGSKQYYTEDQVVGSIPTGEWLLVRPNGKLAHPSFVKYWLYSPSARFQIKKLVKGIHLYPKDIENLEIPLPPLAEQKRIAAILDKADVIRRKRQDAIKLADDFLRATFLDMFGDPVTNPKGWDSEPLGKLCRIRRGASPRPISKFLGGTVPWIKIGDGTKNGDIYIEDTKDKVIEEGVSKSVYLEPGSLIFANCGVSLGFARIIKMGGCIHDGWLSFDQFDEKLNEIYLLKSLNAVTNHFRQTAPDGTQPNLNTSIMKDFRVPLPPRQGQDQFSNIVKKFQRNKQKLNDSGKEVENLFNSLTQRAFRGEL